MKSSKVKWNPELINKVLNNETFQGEVEWFRDEKVGVLCWDNVLEVHKTCGFCGPNIPLEDRLVPSIVKQALEELGFTVIGVQKERHFAGFSRNPHTRWQECPSHGGSGTSFGTWTGAGNASHVAG